jgi:predicted TIM-barrel fold metal-dependent hydrolase
MVVDAHTHILPPVFRAEFARFMERDATFKALFGDTENQPQTVSYAELIAEMDKSGVDVAVAAGYGWTDFETAKISNDYILEAAEKHPTRIVPFCSVNPLWGANAIDELERCHAQGARGVGELHPDTQNLLGVPLTQLVPLMDCAQNLKLPILLHASEPVGHAYPGKGTVTPDKLVALIETFPNNKFIFAHFGGGLPFYALMPEIKKMLANVWFDSAAYNFLYHADVFATCAAAFGAERLLFASDFPLIAQSRALNGLNASTHLSPAEKQLISGGNAVKLFGLSS